MTTRSPTRCWPAARAVSDPLWRMPLWKPYDEMLASDVADLGNMADAPLAGAVTAALFLQKFVPEGTPWAHLDTFAWRPVGQARAAQGRRRARPSRRLGNAQQAAMATDDFAAFSCAILEQLGKRNGL